jgi:hypothetical protein
MLTVLLRRELPIPRCSWCPTWVNPAELIPASPAGTTLAMRCGAHDHLEGNLLLVKANGDRNVHGLASEPNDFHAVVVDQVQMESVHLFVAGRDLVEPQGNWSN